ncbi:hypothetical protein CR513_28197, partial [Mucuna pruriens]
MVEKGYALHFEGDIFTIYDNYNKRQEIAQVEMEKRNRSFLISFKFGHFNSQALKLLYHKNLMRDMPCLKDSNEACEGCLLGKQHMLPFSIDKAWRAKDLLELVHIDICKLMRASSLNNNRYFILFIDDFSRITCVNVLKEKSEVFGIFKMFKTLVEKQSGKHIKVLRSDYGKKYNFHKFDRIERQLTISYSPQQNDFS